MRHERDVGPVRAAHLIDETALAAYLAGQLPDFRGPLTVSQFRGGHSNPTYLLQMPGRPLVLRKKPAGRLLPSAHAIDREAWVMRALRDAGLAVPQIHLYCEDVSVIGTPFFVMDFVRGRVFRDPALPELEPRERGQIYDAMNAALAHLHSIPPAEAGLDGFGRAGNYFARQLDRWRRQYNASSTADIPAMARLIDWLQAHAPEDGPAAVVHGDYRLENMIFHEHEPRVQAVIDWELSTLGHPLADLANNCMPYYFTAPGVGGLVDNDDIATGIPAVSDYVAAYCRRTGRPGIDNWTFFVTFGLFRLAAISQGVYRRGQIGNASSERAQEFGQLARNLANQAWAMVEGR
ncbi:MAG: phosphotransferase [Sneathiellaceae bacterium]